MIVLLTLSTDYHFRTTIVNGYLCSLLLVLFFDVYALLSRNQKFFNSVFLFMLYNLFWIVNYCSSMFSSSKVFILNKIKRHYRSATFTE